MIYLDHASTTFIHDDVIQVITNSLQTFKGNPSSTHALGFEAVKRLNETKDAIGKILHAKKKQLVFTSSGTEANNLIIQGVYQKNKHKQFITTKIEHSSVIHTFEYLESLGASVTYIPVDDEGFIDLEALKDALKLPTALVSIMHVNNELGTVQDIKTIAQICHDHGALFHSDMVQVILHHSVDLDDLNCDFATFSAHKFYGPKGMGLAYLKDLNDIEPFMQGGSQENKKRPGTENLAFAEGFLKALEITEQNRLKWEENIHKNVAFFFSRLNELNIPYQINGPGLNGFRIPSTLNIAFKGIDANALKFFLESKEIYVSLGSACNASSVLPSHVLSKLYDEKRVLSSMRLSFGPELTKEDINTLITHLLDGFKTTKI